MLKPIENHVPGSYSMARYRFVLFFVCAYFATQHANKNNTRSFYKSQRGPYSMATTFLLDCTPCVGVAAGAATALRPRTSRCALDRCRSSHLEIASFRLLVLHRLAACFVMFDRVGPFVSWGFVCSEGHVATAHMEVSGDPKMHWHSSSVV